MRNTPLRIGYCAGIFLLIFAGILFLLTGNGLGAIAEFSLAGLLTGYVLGQVKRGKI